MADVLIVCVREDEPQAKALADMFEAAGFSIGGAPSNDAALRSSGAGVVVWSQASIRSRPFLDAAQRVINAEKAVVASLIEPPPPSSIGDSPAFDLSRWDGDPNDPALDPLFFAVDRMVNAARAGVSATAAEAPVREVPYDPPPPARPAPAPRAAPSYRQTPAGPSPDQLGSEAEHWRAIRDSRDPADFMDYLARYGPDGAFSEVAELRLKQLTGPSDTRAPAPRMRTAAPRSPYPRGQAAPPTRRMEPAPPTRPAAPVRRPPIERDYARDLRDPPKGEGGPVRAFILIGLLGAAALAAGLYFGGGAGTPSAPSGEVIEASSPPGESAGEPADLGGIEEAQSVPLSQAVDNRPQRQAPPAPAREREEPRQQAERAPAQERPAPSTQSASNSSGGPVSLSPGQQQTTSGGPIPLGPSLDPAPTQVASIDPAPSVQRPAPPPAAVVWTQRPSARRISELYPSRALREGTGGRVVLNCRVLSDLSVTCSVASETPAGEGFGRAALSAANAYRARATLSDGSSAVGSTSRIAINFQAR
ncbi:MAG: hypothetical protein R3C25_05900 [Hyphomonadaceae bacterium]